MIWSWLLDIAIPFGHIHGTNNFRQVQKYAEPRERALHWANTEIPYALSSCAIGARGSIVLSGT